MLSFTEYLQEKNLEEGNMRVKSNKSAEYRWGASLQFGDYIKEARRLRKKNRSESELYDGSAKC